MEPRLKLSKELEELVLALRCEGLGVQAHADALSKNLPDTLRDCDQGVRGITMSIQGCRDALEKYEEVLAGVQKQIEEEASSLLDIPDLSTRTKNLLMRFGCRTPLQVHQYSNSFDLRRMSGFGRVSSTEVYDWRHKHFDENQAAWMVEIAETDARLEQLRKASNG